jgi:hypothetical protein
MESEFVSFEELDREHREERARDAERLRTGEITPEALQEENSIFRRDTVITWDAVAWARKTYLSE